ncbi:MAG: HlyD family efflux transporter periplasmic adaptor subunit [Bacteroidetes bacterium]|nr:HlyD family efflux transporter periplasmic adaptor subunit [Bacteroidota bacterium]
MDKKIIKKRWTIKKIVSLSGGVLAIFFVIFYLFIKDFKSQLYVDKSKITISTVEMGKFQEFIPIDGMVMPIKSIVVDIIQGGRIEKIFVEDGNQIKAGDTILKLSNSAIELDYMQRETQMYDIINNLQNTKLNIEQNKFQREKEIVDFSYSIDKAKKDYEKKTGFYKEKIISTVEFEDSKRDYELLIKQRAIAIKSQKNDSLYYINQIAQIKLSIERLFKNLRLLKENLGNLYLKAPVSGQLSLIDCEVGETKDPGQNIGQIDVLDGFKIRAKIDERYISKVFLNQEAELELSEKRYKIAIKKIYTKVSSGSFETDFVFMNEVPEEIKRGQSLSLKLQFSKETNAIVLAKGSFYQETGGNWIYVVDASGNFAYKKDIKIGRQNTTLYEVLSGLKKGEKVITSSYEQFGKKDKLIFN